MLARPVIAVVVLATLALGVGALILASTLISPRETAPYFLVTDDPAVTDQRIDRQASLVQLLTMECMSEAGMPYVPLNPVSASDPDAHLPPREWVAKYGFGVSTRPADGPAIEETDPNVEYMLSLDAGASEAYQVALFGDGSASSRGCLGEAEQATLGPRAAAIAEVQAIFDEMSELEQTDPRMIEALVEWRSCSAGAGLPTSRNQLSAVANEYFGGRLEAIKSAGEIPDAAALEELQAEERRVALAIFDCDERYAQDTKGPHDEIEATWVQKHRQQLVQLRGALLEIDRRQTDQHDALEPGPSSLGTD